MELLDLSTRREKMSRECEDRSCALLRNRQTAGLRRSGEASNRSPAERSAAEPGLTDGRGDSHEAVLIGLDDEQAVLSFGNVTRA